MFAKFVTGMMPGTIGAVMPRSPGRVQESQEDVGVEEELRDGSICAGVEFALEVVEVSLRRRRLRMHLGIGADRDLQIVGVGAVDVAADAGNQIGRVAVSAVDLSIVRSALGSVASQRDDMAHTGVQIAVDDLADLGLGRSDAGEMSGDGKVGVGGESAHGRMGAFLRCAASSVGDADEGWVQWSEGARTACKLLLTSRCCRREELERHLDSGAERRCRPRATGEPLGGLGLVQLVCGQVWGVRHEASSRESVAFGSG